VVTVPVGEGTQEAQQLPQNDNNDEDEEEEEGNEAEGEDDEDYTPLSDSEKDKMYRGANEFKTAGNKASMPTSIDITTPLDLESREFRVEALYGPNMITHH
jgi:hypothetical protein